MENRNKILVVSPSANIIDDEGSVLMKKAENFLKINNYVVTYSQGYDKKNRYTSGTPKRKSQDIMSGFLDKDIDAIISSQGGDNSNDLLELLDYNKISKCAKPFFGLSDVTVLLNVIAVKSKITTYHGIDFLWGLGKNATEYTDKLLNGLLGEGKLEIVKNPNVPKWEIIKEGKGEGIFLGGCLPSFCLLIGTRFDPIEMLNSPFILILEDIGQSKSEINSMLTQLKQHEKFSLCRGVVFGSFYFCEQKPKENDLPIEEIAKEVFRDKNIPIARIQEIGHCVENIIIPIGSKGKLECENDIVSLQFC